MSTVEGRATLIHALAHIGRNVIDLAPDIYWRFAGMPHDFYRQWLVVAKKKRFTSSCCAITCTRSARPTATSRRTGPSFPCSRHS